MTEINTDEKRNAEIIGFATQYNENQQMKEDILGMSHPFSNILLKFNVYMFRVISYEK